MKKIYISLIFLILLSSLSFSQNFMPLKEGNAFMIKEESISYVPGGGWFLKYGKYWVEKDTMVDGKAGYLIKVDDLLPPVSRWHNSIFYYDQPNQKLFIKYPDRDSFQIAVDFKVPKDSTFLSYIMKDSLIFVSDGFSADTILNISTESFFMDQLNVELYEDVKYKFSDGFGLTHLFHHWGSSNFGGNVWDTLHAAIIDTTIYNDFTFRIDSLFPVEDRPKNLFPFELNTKIYSPYRYSLIDSSFLEIKLIRDDSTLASWWVEGEDYYWGYYFRFDVPISSSIIKVGDIIKVRAVMSDNSIFNHSAEYPDSGYIEIEVIPEVTGISNDPEKLEMEFHLSQNYPNPFNPVTKIKFTIPAVGTRDRVSVQLKVYDVLGNKIATLVDDYKPAGSYDVEFNASLLTSGIYFYQLKAGNYIETKKMILLK